MSQKKRFLYLEDGTVLEGFGFGSSDYKTGELVFTTAMNGYPESLTDPSYKGQILLITHPLVGNYGVPGLKSKDGIISNFESESIKAEGLVVSELTHGMKWNSSKSLDEWLKENNIPGISGIDTRALTKKVREEGVMACIISDDAIEDAEARFKRSRNYDFSNLVGMVSPKEPVMHGSGNEVVVVVDFGVKHGILENLSDLGYRIIRVPYNYSAEEIMAFKPNGIVYSNGPGNPNLLLKEAETFKSLLEYNIPTLAICLGHQIASMALSGEVRKMKFGHRAINKAVVDQMSKRSYITTHNHGYEVSKDALPEDSEIWFNSPDDDVVEGLRFKRMNLLTVQFHPEARPGTNDTRFIFNLFGGMVHGSL